MVDKLAEELGNQRNTLNNILERIDNLEGFRPPDREVFIDEKNKLHNTIRDPWLDDSCEPLRNEIVCDDDEDDEGDDANRDSSEYFQKLTSTINESYIETYHPESMSHNYDEIQTLSRVVRNSAGVIVDDLHRTIPIMTKYEKTRVLGQRAKQLNEGAPAFIKIDSTVIDGYLIAVKELEQKKTPFIIRRPLPNGGSEYWRIQDLEIL
jgi:DNA-directed RNA polymerase I, II, and III subunit RPABC2